MEQRENGDGESGSEGIAKTITPSEDYHALRRALLGLTKYEERNNVEQQDNACCCLEGREKGNSVPKEKITLGLGEDLKESLLEEHVKETWTKAMKLNKEWILELNLKRQQNVYDNLEGDKVVALKQSQVPEDFSAQSLRVICGGELYIDIDDRERQEKSAIQSTDELGTRIEERQNVSNKSGPIGDRENPQHASNSCTNREHQHLQCSFCGMSGSNQPSDNYKSSKSSCLKNLRQIEGEEIYSLENTTCSFQEKESGAPENITCKDSNNARNSIHHKCKIAPECRSKVPINDNNVVEIEEEQSNLQVGFDTMDSDETEGLSCKNFHNPETDSGPVEISLQNIVFKQLKYYLSDMEGSEITDNDDCNKKTKQYRNLMHKLKSQDSKEVCKNVAHNNMQGSSATNNVNQSKKESECRKMLNKLSEESVWKTLQEALEELISQHLLETQSHKQTENSEKSIENVDCKKSNEEQLQYAIRDYIRLYLGPKRNNCDLIGRPTVMLNSSSDAHSNCNCAKLLKNAKIAEDKGSQQEHLCKIPEGDFYVFEKRLGVSEDPIESLKQNSLQSYPGSDLFKSCNEASANTSTETILEAPEEFRVPDTQPSNDHSLEPTDHENNIELIPTEAVDTSHRSQSTPPSVPVGVTTPTPASSSSEVVSEDVHSMALLSTLRGLKVTMAECTGSIDGFGGVGVGVEIDSRAPGCSRGTDADWERTLDTEQKTDSCCCCSAKDSSCDKCNSVVETRSSPLRWAFKNGRLVFVEEEEEGDEGESESEKEQDGDEIIHSKELNRRITGSVEVAAKRDKKFRILIGILILCSMLGSMYLI